MSNLWISYTFIRFWCERIINKSQFTFTFIFPQSSRDDGNGSDVDGARCCSRAESQVWCGEVWKYWPLTNHSRRLHVCIIEANRIVFVVRKELRNSYEILEGNLSFLVTVNNAHTLVLTAFTGMACRCWNLIFTCFEKHKWNSILLQIHRGTFDINVSKAQTTQQESERCTCFWFRITLWDWIMYVMN